MRALPSGEAAIDALLAYLVLGALAGLLAGLLGVGGGVVIVPALNAVFLRLGFDPAQSFHLALGSSLATIVFTGLSSAAAHRRRGAVRGIWLRRLGPWTALGTFAGGLGAAFAPRPWLQGFFALFLVFVAWRLWAAPGPRRGRAGATPLGPDLGPDLGPGADRQRPAASKPVWRAVASAWSRVWSGSAAGRSPCPTWCGGAKGCAWRSAPPARSAW